MYDLLKGLRVVEGSAFVAGPTCGLYLAQLGAEVIRFDNIGGGPDFHRWPLSQGGDSFYWEGLNKSKKSIAIDLSRPEGRRLAQELATAPGDDGGAFVTNFPVEGFLSYDDLSVIEPDDLMEMGGLTAEQVDAIVAEAEQRASQVEAAAADERRKQREADRIAKATADADAADAVAAEQVAESGAAPAPESVPES
jgi:hypothetical protein